MHIYSRLAIINPVFYSTTSSKIYRVSKADRSS
jgi:hypothetical protein